MSESTVQHPRRRGRPLYLPWILLLALAALLATASGASAQTAETAAPSPTGDSGLLVTIAARTCPEYTDITANRARNDIQESLRDLGADTPYSDGDQVDPDIEQTSQPNCTPLNDWDFTLGRNYQTRAVDGPWGSLSIVTDPYSTPITTQPSIPLLNSQGEVIPGRQIEAAVTIELSDDQADRASRNNSLWLQGGTPADPILDQKFPGQYGFGALRCAIDNLNGDNVEWIAYPQGTKHVFCFAYYVTPPPTSGEIVIRKEIAEPDAARTTFPFDGNLSFNVGGEFDLSAAGGEPDSETFIRAETRPGEDPWTVTEAVPPDWTLTDLTCVSESGESSAETSLQAATADITLSAGDTVTCTFTNSSEPPQAGLSINKLTEGGVGRFSYTVTPLGEDGATRSAVARTSEEGVATPATPNVISLAPGRYRIVERLPSSDDGSWRLRRVVCNGDVVEPERNGVVVELSAGEGVSCTFTNRFRPETGSIVIRKVTRAGVGPAAFLVVPVERALGGSGRRAGGRLALPLGQIRAQAARTTEPGRPVRARGQSTSRLPLGTYFIQELMNPRQWDLESVTCNGQLVPFARGLTAVRLTESRRRVVCTFENVRQPDPTPPTPPEPPTPPAPPQPPTPPAPPTPPTPPTPPSVPVTPATPVAPGPSAVPESRILLTKTASRSSIELGETLTYTIRVRNAGPDIAQQVVVWEQTRGRAIIKSLTTSQGRCRSAPRPRGCFLGELEPGQTVTIRVRAQPTETGNLRNVVAAGSATASTSVRVSRAIERIRVLQRRPAIGFTG